MRNDRYAVEDIEGERQSWKRYQGGISVDRLEFIPKQSFLKEKKREKGYREDSKYFSEEIVKS